VLKLLSGEELKEHEYAEEIEDLPGHIAAHKHLLLGK
jgi:hypothetical protein